MSLSPSTLTVLQTIVTDASTGIQAIEALVSLLGLDETTVVNVLKNTLPAPDPAGPDIASEYEEAKAKAEGK